MWSIQICFFVVCNVTIDFMVEFCYEWMVGVGVSEVISVLYFGEDVLWDWFIAFIYVATWYIYCLSACIIVSVIYLVSRWILLEGV